MRQRQNRSQQGQDEKLVAFRMSTRRYRVLKAIAARHKKPVAQLINEVLNRQLKLEKPAEL